MKITKSSTPKKLTHLEQFSQRTFTLELNGFELLALKFVSEHIGGVGKTRSVFSYCNDKYGTCNFMSILSEETDQDTWEEFTDAVHIQEPANGRNGLYINDKLQ